MFIPSAVAATMCYWQVQRMRWKVRGMPRGGAVVRARCRCACGLRQHLRPGAQRMPTQFI